MLNKVKSASGGKTRIVNILKNFSGASLSSIFIIMVILIVGGSYGWQKYQEHKFPEKAARGEIIGPFYYIKAIKLEIDRILEKKDTKGKRAMELAESTKKINDKANLYSFEFPQSWVIIVNEGAQGAQVSRLAVQNSYYSGREENKIKIIDQGAEFSIIVTRGENKSGGGHAGKVATKNDAHVGGKENVLHIFKEAGYPGAEIIDDHVVFGGNTYIFRLAYNPQTFSDAEFTFREILASVKFLK
ncbi:MAG: hypothetical protein WC608_02290 [Parcubacteria group bacterium]